MVDFTTFFTVLCLCCTSSPFARAVSRHKWGHGISEGSCLSMQAAASHTVESGQSSHCDHRATPFFCFPPVTASTPRVTSTGTVPIGWRLRGEGRKRKDTCPPTAIQIRRPYPKSSSAPVFTRDLLSDKPCCAHNPLDRVFPPFRSFSWANIKRGETIEANTVL